MKQETKDEIITRRYLLGELSQKEQVEFEQRLMTDGDCFHLASVLEEELIDEYLYGNLSNDEKKRFSRRFLSSPEGCEQLKLAANLRRYARNSKINPMPRSSVTDAGPLASERMPMMRARFSTARLALVATVVLLATILTVLVFSVWRLQRQVASLRAGQELPSLREQELQNQVAEQQARNDELARSLQREQEERARLEKELIALSGSTPDRSQSLIAAITLAPGSLRSTGRGNKLIIKSRASQVLLNLLVREDDYVSYQAALENESGKPVWTADSLKSEVKQGRKVIRASIPVRFVPEGDYRLHLQGRTSSGDYEDAGNYYFRVVKE